MFPHKLASIVNASYVAPDRFASSDVCLGAGADVRACSLVTRGFPAVWWRGHARTCVRGVGLKLLRKAVVLLRVDFDI